MKLYNFTYNDFDTINNVKEIRANSANEAYTIFFDTVGIYVDIVQIEQMEE